MPYHATLVLQPRTWTPLTTAAVYGLRAQVQGPVDILVQATATNVQPASAQGALMLRAGPAVALLPTDMLSDLFPGVPNAAWAWAWAGGESTVSVSHA